MMAGDETPPLYCALCGPRQHATRQEQQHLHRVHERIVAARRAAEREPWRL
jgi:hypothetical protein